jgi:hypothetical protein
MINLGGFFYYAKQFILKDTSMVYGVHSLGCSYQKRLWLKNGIWLFFTIIMIGLYQLSASAADFDDKKKYSELEYMIASELSSSGVLLEGDARFEGVVSRLAERAASLSGETSISSEWLYAELASLLPEIENEMLKQAILAASRESVQVVNPHF